MEGKVIPKLKITKLSAARRQLETAVKLYFYDEDPVSIHTLVNAAHEILSVLKKTRGAGSMIVSDELIKEPYKKQVRAKIKEAANFFKHGKRDPNLAIDFNPNINEPYLIDACEAYMLLTGEKVHSFTVFRTWFNCKYPNVLNIPEVYQASALAKENWGENKRQFYKEMMEHLEDL